MKITIIIAVYNIESYIERCVRSIVNQQVNNCSIEIILINDGSTDSSHEICDYLARQYDNIFVYHKINGGLSDARNYGFTKSTGNYVWFVDGDDYIGEKSLKKIVSLVDSTPVDIINIGYEKIYSDGTSEKMVPPQSGVDSGIDALNILGAIPAWTSIYRTQFLIDNNLQFVNGLIHEDFEFNIRSYSLAKQVRFCNEPLYKYICQRTNSIMNSISSRSPICYAYSANAIHKFINQYHFTIEEREIILRTAAIGLTLSFERISLLDKMEFHKVFDYFKQNRNNISSVLKHHTPFYQFIGIIFKYNPLFAYRLYLLAQKCKTVF